MPRAALLVDVSSHLTSSTVSNWPSRDVACRELTMWNSPSRPVSQGMDEVSLNLLLMEDILHHLGCTKHRKWWDKLLTSTGPGFLPSTVWQMLLISLESQGWFLCTWGLAHFASVLDKHVMFFVLVDDTCMMYRNMCCFLRMVLVLIPCGACVSNYMRNTSYPIPFLYSQKKSIGVAARHVIIFILRAGLEWFHIMNLYGHPK